MYQNAAQITLASKGHFWLVAANFGISQANKYLEPDHCYCSNSIWGMFVRNASIMVVFPPPAWHHSNGRENY